MNAPFALPAGFHAVVIGGAGDIGAAIANLFCDLGATVTASGVTMQTSRAPCCYRDRDCS